MLLLIACFVLRFDGLLLFWSCSTYYVTRGYRSVSLHTILPPITAPPSPSLRSSTLHAPAPLTSTTALCIPNRVRTRHPCAHASTPPTPITAASKSPELGEEGRVDVPACGDHALEDGLLQLVVERGLCFFCWLVLCGVMGWKGGRLLHTSIHNNNTNPSPARCPMPFQCYPHARTSH